MNPDLLSLLQDLKPSKVLIYLPDGSTLEWECGPRDLPIRPS